MDDHSSMAAGERGREVGERDQSHQRDQWYQGASLEVLKYVGPFGPLGPFGPFPSTLPVALYSTPQIRYTVG